MRSEKEIVSKKFSELDLENITLGKGPGQVTFHRSMGDVFYFEVAEGEHKIIRYRLPGVICSALAAQYKEGRRSVQGDMIKALELESFFVVKTP
jgi:hypothetical protein